VPQVCPTEIIAFNDRAEEFLDLNTQLIAGSTDTEEVPASDPDYLLGYLHHLPHSLQSAVTQRDQCSGVRL
jgi:hypothetical protein